MQTVVELLHTALSVCGCGCLDADFWQPSSRHRAHPGADPLGHASRAGLRDSHMDELLLAAEPSAGSMDGDDTDSQLSHAVSSSSEEMFRQGSFNTKVTILRSQSPFYRAQQPQIQHPQPVNGIELKTTNQNVLLGQQHMESRGKYVAAHPVSVNPGGAVRRGASPVPQVGIS